MKKTFSKSVSFLFCGARFENISPRMLLNLYIIYSLVTSCLDMCNSIIYGIPHHQLDQNTVARILTLTKKRSHITPVLIDLHWLPVKQRIEFKLLLFVFKSLHGSAVSYLFEILHDHKPGRTGLRSTKLHLLQEPWSDKSFGDRSFTICAPKLWNNISTHIKNCRTLSALKTALKTHLFKSAFVNEL